MVPNIYWFFSVAPTELSDIGDRHSVQRPQCVFIEGFNAFLKAYFDAISEKVILPQQVLFLNFRLQRGVIFFSDRHKLGRMRLTCAHKRRITATT